MDPCLIVEEEIDKIHNKFTDVNEFTAKSIDELIKNITDAQSELEGCTEDSELSVAQNAILRQYQKKLKDTLSRVGSEHKDLHGSVSKIGKAIDRNFVSEFTSIITDEHFDSAANAPHINGSICEHFLRHGMLDIADTFIEDASLDIEHDQKDPFLELNSILEALKQQELKPALEWALRNRNELRSRNSSLEFRLHRLHFIQLLKAGSSKQQEALEYAKNFEPFAASHTKDLQVLMGSLLYLPKGIENSPYSYLLDPVIWAEICDIFTKDACTLLGLSVHSPLSVVIQAGCVALPPLLNIKQVMSQRQCSGVWSSKDELPVEIELGTEHRYHSIFACPILRQQSNDSNPPVRLVCGHVISKDALNKLAAGNKVKCPYCPMEQAPSDAKQISF